MDIQEITKFALNNIIPILAGLGVVALILLALLINLYMKVSYMKKRYRKMMTGADGANLERMLIGHLNEIQAVSDENAAIKRGVRAASGEILVFLDADGQHGAAHIRADASAALNYGAERRRRQSYSQ